MPLGKQKDDGDMFASGDRLEVDRMLSETQRMLHNTRSFLESIHEDDDAARDYVETLNKNLKNEERRLKQQRYAAPRPELEK